MYMTISYQRMTLNGSLVLWQNGISDRKYMLSLSTQGELKRENVRSYIGQKTKALINLNTLSARKKFKKLNQSYQDNIEGKSRRKQFF